MKQLPTAEEFWLNSYFSDSISQEDKELWLECNNQAKESIKIMKEFAKLHVEQALKEASEKVVLDYGDYLSDGNYERVIDKDSILNSYPLSNIK